MFPLPNQHYTDRIRVKWRPPVCGKRQGGPSDSLEYFILEFGLLFLNINIRWTALLCLWGRWIPNMGRPTCLMVERWLISLIIQNLPMTVLPLFELNSIQGTTNFWYHRDSVSGGWGEWVWGALREASAWHVLASCSNQGATLPDFWLLSEKTN